VIESYLDPEAKARIEIDKMLRASGWAVQDYKTVHLGASRGVAVREFVMADGHEAADYLLFIDRTAVGVIEAKKAGTTLTGVEWQSAKYRGGLPAGISAFSAPLPFAYESTGVETRFTNGLEPEPASRDVFNFYRPDTLAEMLQQRGIVRAGLKAMPALDERGLRRAQIAAIDNLEASLAHGRPRALVQMATGSGKTYTAANVAYRLIKYAGARRVLFLVDRATLGEQTLKEFQAFSTPDDGRKFTELYNVQHLKSNHIDPVSRVTISTIQRLYSILRGEPELAEELDETPSFELAATAPVEVAYNPRVPVETFDVIIVDECHRSIYGLWRQVFEYFDAFIIGLTATPGKQTLGFFNQNLVMEYSHDKAVADGVNVDFDVFRISTEISERGSRIDAGLVTRFRDRQTRQQRFEALDDDIVYDAAELDRKVVAKDQIRTIVRAFRDNLPQLFRGRTYVPKTLIFAKDDSHADDIVQIVREEFGKGNDFAVKITYKSGSQGQQPEKLLKAFRNSFDPRIAVTVDMIATGTDVKPLECVFFMRMVRSRTFFEQMKGRGTRTIDASDLQIVTPDAPGKDRFVLVDAVGVTEKDLNDTVPLERYATLSLERLLHKVALGDREVETASSVASRIARLDRRLNDDDRADLERSAGMPLKELAETIVDALDADRHLGAAQAATGRSEPTADEVHAAAANIIDAALRPIADNPEFRTKLVEMRRNYDQVIDDTSADRVTHAAHTKDVAERARATIASFKEFLEANKDEITALQILYSRPYRQRLTFAQVKELANAIERPPRRWTPEALWAAYEQLDRSKVHGSGTRVLTDLVSLVRYAIGDDSELIPFPEKVEARFRAWLAQQRQAGRTFTDEQMAWLYRIRDQIATGLIVARDDFDETPFAQHGGLGKAYDLFGDQLDPLLTELRDTLAA